MSIRGTAGTALAAFAMAAAVMSATAQGTGETLTATATVKAASGATASAPVTIVISRTMPPEEADKLVAALKTGGAAGLRKALAGVPPTGSIRIGNGDPIDTRMAIARTTDKGRLLTIVSDQPLLFVGASLPGAKPKAGYDFSVLDIEVDAAGSGSGTLAPAATIKVSGNAIVVGDYGAERVQLLDVKRAK
jgi:hypothetical protein